MYFIAANQAPPAAARTLLPHVYSKYKITFVNTQKVGGFFTSTTTIILLTGCKIDEFTPKSSLMQNHQIIFCLEILFNRSTVQQGKQKKKIRI